jgi:FixJ family two-component response regulator
LGRAQILWCMLPIYAASECRRCAQSIGRNERTINRNNSLIPSAPIVHLVDDDESFRVAIGRLLRAARYEVHTYASVGDFLLAKLVDAPGCLVLDVSMPGPSGLDLQEALGKTEQSVPVVFLTGHGDIPMSVRAMKAGAVDFLTKPVKKETLLEAVKTAVALDAERRAHRNQMVVWRTRYQSLTPR